MTDLHTRFQSLDALQAPDLWSEVEQRAMASQPTARRSAWVLIAVSLLLVLVLGGAVLVGSGIVKLPITVDASASPSSSAQESAAASPSAVAQVPGSWTVTGSMAADRANHTATLLLDGRVLVVGSLYIADGGPPSPSTELYDPSKGSWTATGSMIEGRVLNTATLLPDGRVLVMDDGPSGSAELYDPDTGTWTSTASMIEAGAGTATVLLDGMVLVTGVESAFAELYDPATGTWAATASPVEVHHWRTATLLLDGRVLVTDGSATGSAELYDPDTGTWSATGSMIEKRSWQAATLLPDGTVLVAGGMGSTGIGSDEVAFLLDSAELYDPRSGTWSATGSMIEARHDYKATRLSDGKVLVTGGGLASNELYDPKSRTWTATVSMVVAREGHTATLLPDGTVLVVGGYGDVTSLSSAELYNPGSGS